MKKSMKAIALLLACILVLNLPIGINATELGIDSKHVPGNIVIGTRDNEISQRLSEIEGKLDYDTISKIVNEVYPHAIILDKTVMNNLKSVIELKEMILEKNIGLIKNIGEIKITEDYFDALKSIFNSDIEDVYIVIHYDIGEIIRTIVIAFCAWCMNHVATEYIKQKLPPEVRNRWLVQFFLDTYTCMICFGLISSNEGMDYLQPVPVCGMCQQDFSYVNGNWYCYNCQVWD